MSGSKMAVWAFFFLASVLLCQVHGDADAGEPADTPDDPAVTPDDDEVEESDREKLIKFYEQYVPQKTEADVDNAMKNFEGKYDEMWELLEEKYEKEIAKGSVKKMSVKELRTKLKSFGVKCSGCTEKREFVKKLLDVMDNPELANERSNFGGGGGGGGQSAGGGSGADVVIAATEATFDELVFESSQPVMVEFFAPWCGHCKELAPKWEEAAAELAGSVKFITVDATEEGPLAQKYGVEGYPTIKGFRVGTQTAFDYNIGRTKSDLIKYAKELLVKHVPKIDSSQITFEPSQLADALKASPDALVAFVDGSKKSKKVARNFLKVSNSLRKRKNREGFAGVIVVDCIDGDCEDYATEFPTVKYFVGGKDVAIYERTTSTVKLLTFVKKHSVEAAEEDKPEKWGLDGEEAVNILSPKRMGKFLEEHPSTLVFFYTPWCGHCKSAKPGYIEAAQTLQEQGDDAKGTLAAVDCVTYAKLCRKYKVNSYPTIKYFKNGKYNSDFSRERQTQSYIDFFEDPEASPPKPTQEPFLEEDHKVKILSESTFPTFATESVLVMFYAPWCGHCKSAKPGYAEAAEQLVDDNSKHVIAAVDCTVEKELCGTYGVSGYPTFKYFSGGKSSDYTGGRDADSYVDFLNTQPDPSSPADHEEL